MLNRIDEYNHLQEILITLEPKLLTEALLKLAIESHSAYMMVLSLASTTAGKIELFKENIHTITHQTRRSTLSGKEILVTLHRSLEMLDPAIIDSKEGLLLMASFYETDSWALESTTELDYEFELVYTDDGFKKFAEFARRCPDPEFVAQVVNKLLADNGYSMRTKLFDEASTFLPEAGLKMLRTR